MKYYDYLIVGGGIAADSAVRGIRDLDQKGSIGLISAERNPPYDRPPLTKKLWKGMDLEEIWRRTDARGVEITLGRRVVSLDAKEKLVTDDQHNDYSYRQLLLATGGTPRRLPFGGEQILHYRTLDDYWALRALTMRKQRFGIIGGGFVGSEIAAALAMIGKDVVMIFPQPGLGGRVFTPDVGKYLVDFYRRKRVEMHPEDTVTATNKRPDGKLALVTKSGQELVVDAVIAGIGIQPNTELAQRAGLTVANGIEVNEYLRTNDSAICAAGDVAEFYNPLLDKRLRVEHEDNANAMGRQAGRNMAGEHKPYHYLPMFYSDLFEIGYEAVGELDSAMETFIDWQEPYQQGAIYYLTDGHVRGVLLWDIWGQIEAARQLIAEPKSITPASLKGRLPQ
jgi:NADPH-dependent 2,4-dienoyl-CoA reductase/sulfur reductase-like enzyme